MDLKNYFENIVAERKAKKELKEKEKNKKETEKKLIIHRLCEDIKEKLSFLEEYGCSVTIVSEFDIEYVNFISKDSSKFELHPCIRKNGSTDTKYNFYDYDYPDKRYYTYESFIRYIVYNFFNI